MKLTALWEQYQSYTKDVTDYSRKLAFATAAICWFFKTPQVTFPKPVIFALLLVVTFFVLDLLQSLVAALTLRFYTRSQEKTMWAKERTIEGEVLKPDWVDYPAFVLFLFKVVSLFGAFSCLFAEFYRRLGSAT